MEEKSEEVEGTVLEQIEGAKGDRKAILRKVATIHPKDIYMGECKIRS